MTKSLEWVMEEVDLPEGWESRITDGVLRLERRLNLSEYPAVSSERVGVSVIPGSDTVTVTGDYGKLNGKKKTEFGRDEVGEIPKSASLWVEMVNAELEMHRLKYKLKNVDYVGSRLAGRLYVQIGSADEVGKASVEELEEVGGIGPKTARKIVNDFGSEGNGY